jgi:hypothetical protein
MSVYRACRSKRPSPREVMLSEATAGGKLLTLAAALPTPERAGQRRGQ